MTNRTSKQRLNEAPSKSRRVILESGDVVNIADFEHFNLTRNIEWLTENGRVWQSFWDGQIPAKGEIYFRQFIDFDTETNQYFEVKGISLSATVSRGPVVFEMQLGAESDIGDQIDAYNAKRSIDIQPTRSYITKVPSIDITGDIVDKTRRNPAQGGASFQSAELISSAAGGIFGGPGHTDEPFFVYKNEGDEDVNIIIKWVWADITGLDKEQIVDL